ncbi:lectin-like domain-containing protein [Levilactobacillus koreensis]|uniref:Extracellular protein n=1 Tax=Levilactobacillus koreensis TaxID=637971 RepID=A0AAC8UTF2_9LACO|nr:hypothetical protein [Levilactobacillus koreensis]AKP63935.1 hypothetical protein ABN16_02280 [Levilactobacillus koreensis]
MGWKKLFLAAAVAIAGIGIGQQVAYGQTWSAMQAVKNAPQGLLMGDYFDTDFGLGNSAQVLDPSKTTAPNTQVVQLTSNGGQIGWVWTNDATKINLKQNATAAMWMYFDGQSSSSGDGMAFVVQNDSRGTAAHATGLAGANVGGETLGTWGTDQNYTSPSADSIVNTAVQNSWAIEFDTYVNKKIDKGTVASSAGANAFDADMNNYPHIASNYPAQASTYQMRNAGTTSDPAYYAVLDHKGAITSNDYKLMTDGNWHHLTVKWNATKQTMTYDYNDKDPKTGAPLTGKTQTVSVDPNIIDPQHTGFARWGFTGSTGTAVETNAVDFEQIPGIVSSTAKATLTDETQGQDVTSGSTIYSGDHVKLNYELNYESGSQNWKDISARIKLPTNLTFGADEANNIGRITYANGDTQAIPAGDLSGQSLTTLLEDELSAENDSAKITLNGTVDHSGSAGTVAAASTVSNFVGSNAIATSNLDGFNVTSVNSSMTLALTGASNADKDAATPAEATVTAKATILGGTATDATIHPVVNGKTAADVKITASQATNGFTYTVPVENLQPGVNKVVLYLTDSLHDVSNSVTANINYVAGSLDFGDVSTDVTYAGNLTGGQQQLAPAKPWSVNVADTRGKDSSWKLTASATPLVDGTHTLAGSLVYQTNTATAAQLLGSTSVLIADHTNSDGSLTPFNVASDWTGKTGIFLNVNGGATAGDYEGTVNWTLVNGE